MSNKYVYVLYINRKLGTKHWYIDRIYIKEKNANIRGKIITSKFKKGGYTIEKWRIYE